MEAEEIMTSPPRLPVSLPILITILIIKIPILSYISWLWLLPKSKCDLNVVSLVVQLAGYLTSFTVLLLTRPPP